MHEQSNSNLVHPGRLVLTGGRRAGRRPRGRGIWMIRLAGQGRERQVLHSLGTRRTDMFARVSTYQPGPDGSGAPSDDTVNRVLQTAGMPGHLLLAREGQQVAVHHPVGRRGSPRWQRGGGNQDPLGDQRGATHADPRRRGIRSVDASAQGLKVTRPTAGSVRHANSCRPGSRHDSM